MVRSRCIQGSENSPMRASCSWMEDKRSSMQSFLRQATVPALTHFSPDYRQPYPKKMESRSPVDSKQIHPAYISAATMSRQRACCGRSGSRQKELAQVFRKNLSFHDKAFSWNNAAIYMQNSPREKMKIDIFMRTLDM